MARIFGLVVTAIWFVFTYMALSAASEGAAAGQADVAFWFRITAFLLGVAGLVALVGTVRYRHHGPTK